MGEPIENEYFNWLCAKVLEPNTRSYYELLGILYKTEFEFVVSEDRHRIDDGLELRDYFMMESGNQRDLGWEGQPCSVFEMFLSFADRASFQTDIPVRDWFWQIMSNLMLDQFRQLSNSDIPIIERILNTFIWRTYDQNGVGGMFPMSHTTNDQTKIEIWQQFFEYLDEQGI